MSYVDELRKEEYERQRREMEFGFEWGDHNNEQMLYVDWVKYKDMEVYNDIMCDKYPEYKLPNGHMKLSEPTMDLNIQIAKAFNYTMWRLRNGYRARNGLAFGYNARCVEERSSGAARGVWLLEMDDGDFRVTPFKVVELREYGYDRHMFSTRTAICEDNGQMLYLNQYGNSLSMTPWLSQLPENGYPTFNFYEYISVPQEMSFETNRNYYIIRAQKGLVRNYSEIVAKVFIGDRPNESYHLFYKDGNPRNISPANLMWSDKNNKYKTVRKQDVRSMPILAKDNWEEAGDILFKSRREAASYFELDQKTIGYYISNNKPIIKDYGDCKIEYSLSYSGKPVTEYYTVVNINDGVSNTYNDLTSLSESIGCSKSYIRRCIEDGILFKGIYLIGRFYK